MGTRSLADVPPTSTTMAMNALFFGYSGHSLVTPHAALKQLWWTDECINAKITRPFVLAKLRGEEHAFLDRQLAFGEGLTDDTYMDWILTRAKRLFLILAEIGIPDQIFGCIDDSWDDEDLPVSLNEVQHLQLAYENDEALNKKFYDLQFIYLLRELKAGSHIDYGPKERIPMEYVNTLPPAIHLQTCDRVHLPKDPEHVFMRRKFTMTGSETSGEFFERFAKDVQKAQELVHEHIAPVWGSYTTAEKTAYTLSNFVGEHTLASFIDHRSPTQYTRVPAAERTLIVCEWMHCLADALAFLHQCGIAHTAIQPSNIIIDENNRIAFADVGSIKMLQRNKRPTKAETYDYAPPESQLCQSPRIVASSPPVSSVFSFRKLRKLSISTSSSSTSSARSSGQHDSFYTAGTNPSTPTCSCPPTCDDLTSPSTSSIFLSARSMASSRSLNFSRHVRNLSSSSSPTPLSPCSITTTTSVCEFHPPRTIDPDTLTALPRATAQMSDIFSLACVYLDMLTFLVQGKRTEFIAFRTTPIKLLISAQGARTKTIKDKSFHVSHDRIEIWMQRLESESTARVKTEPVFHAIPSILALIRRMLSQNAHLRPDAIAVRDYIRTNLEREASVTRLCCADREWQVACQSNALEEQTLPRDSECARPPSVHSSSEEFHPAPSHGHSSNSTRWSSTSARPGTMNSLRRILTRLS
ncbi:kinase-like protein [Acrodontium crateriforme]|uniref:Kinase-like protein n=1 Tax=Acrodontium crateriforme TaxID=150365 RepID=A0AAQ3R9D1_9PEZI|nr:kinase-like protein [Acrodontium crateriforme]